jgi:hypothetical protein
LHRDYLGSVVAVTNQTGTITERRHFDAWGLLSHYRNAFGGTTLPDGVITFLFLDRDYTNRLVCHAVSIPHNTLTAQRFLRNDKGYGHESCARTGEAITNRG